MKQELGISSYWKVVSVLSVLYFCFQVFDFAADITLKWTPNTEPNLARI
jgi:hypothetical protein